MNIKQRYEALKYNRNFEKLNVEFLIITLAENIQYIVLVLTALSLIGLADFNLNPSHFPDLSISGELAKFKALGYNPLTIYLHFIWIFFMITKGFALGFFNTVKSASYSALLVSVIIVNIWLAYSKLKYGYDSSTSKQHNAFFDMMKNYLFASNLIERSLWMLFFIDLMVFITTPGKEEVYFLLGLYGLILSVKLVPQISRAVIELSKVIEKTFIRNGWVLIGVAIADIILIYFDSKSLFTLLLLVILYNGVAQIVFEASKKSKSAFNILKYAFNIGIFIFFFSIVAIYFISYAAVLVLQSPIIAVYYYKNKKFLPAWIMEIVNGVFLAVLLALYFRII